MNAKTANAKLYQLVVSGLLCAIGIVIPMFMPKVVLGPMSFTLASHVPIFIAMFISAPVAIAVCIGTTIGFFIQTTPIIALRAASHIIFALIGAAYLKKHPETLTRPVHLILFNLIIGVIHAACEVIAVSPFFFADSLFQPAQLENGYLMSVVFLVGLGTLIHSLIDFTISIAIWTPISRASGLS